jgi:hypothetical protein
MDNIKVKQINVHDLALQAKKVRSYQKLYAVQKSIASTSGTQEDRAAAARSLHISQAQEKVLDFMVEQVLLGDKEVVNG